MSLPVRMATHFDAAGNANGWMTREASLGFALMLTTVMLLVFSVVLYLAQCGRAPGQFAWALLAFFLLIVAVIYRVNASIVNHALTGAPVEIGWVLLTVPLAIVGLMFIYFRSHRGSAFPSTDADMIAEETHAGRAWALVLLLPAIPVAGAAMRDSCADGANRNGSSSSRSCWSRSAAAWFGFQYRLLAIWAGDHDARFSPTVNSDRPDPRVRDRDRGADGVGTAFAASVMIAPMCGRNRGVRDQHHYRRSFSGTQRTAAHRARSRCDEAVRAFIKRLAIKSRGFYRRRYVWRFEND